MTKQLDKAFNISPTEVVVEKTESVGIQKPSRLTQDDIVGSALYTSYTFNASASDYFELYG